MYENVIVCIYVCVCVCMYMCGCTCVCVVHVPAVTGGGCSSTTSVTSSSLTSKILSTSIHLQGKKREGEMKG